MSDLNYAVVFPGQGSQVVGMGKDLYEKNSTVQEIFNKAEEITNLPIKEITFNGPIDKLKKTQFTQPCITTVNSALYKAFIKEIEIPPSFTCGHSAGEYSALYASGTLNFEDTIQLIKHRGNLMSAAEEGGMLAIFNASDEEIYDFCEKAMVDGGTLAPANWNSKNQTVISGDTNSIENAMEISFEMGISLIPLPVSGAFHSSLMTNSMEKFKKHFKEVSFRTTSIPLVANTVAKPIKESRQWPQVLLDQLIHPVQWRQSIKYLIDQDINIFIEIGPGSVLSNLIAKDYPDCQVFNINDQNSLNNTIHTLNRITKLIQRS